MTKVQIGSVLIPIHTRKNTSIEETGNSIQVGTRGFTILWDKVQSRAVFCGVQVTEPSTSACPVIEYIIVHELTRLLEANHTSEFWNRVAAQLPNYEKAKAWLKENGHELEKDF